MMTDKTAKEILFSLDDAKKKELCDKVYFPAEKVLFNDKDLQRQYIAESFLSFLPEIQNARPEKHLQETINSLNLQKADRPDFETLSKYIEYGFSVYAKKAGKDGKPLFYSWEHDTWTKESSRINTIEELQKAIEHGIERFSFYPAEKNFICFDIDRNHADGRDGIDLFFSFLEKNNLSDLPIFHKPFTFVQSANGGIHLYFFAESFYKVYEKSNDYERYLHNLEGTTIENCEVKAGARELTCAGSIKTDKDGIKRPYTMYGTLPEVELFQTLAGIFEKLIVKTLSQKELNQKDTRETIENIVSKKWYFLKKDGKQENKKDCIKQIYKYCKYKGYYDLDQITQAILQNKEIESLFNANYITAELKDLQKEEGKPLEEILQNAKLQGYGRAECSYSVGFHGTLNGHSETDILNFIQTNILAESDFSENERSTNAKNGIKNAKIKQGYNQTRKENK